MLIEKTDIDLFNQFKDSNEYEVVYSMSLRLLKYDKEITELAIKKGIDFSKIINLLLSEFNHESLNSPIDKLRDAQKPSFYSDKEFLNLFDRIELLLKNGVGYNCSDDILLQKTLQYAERIYYVHKLLDRVHELYKQKNDKSISPLGTILKLIIDSMNRSSDFRGYKIIIDSRQIYLLPNYEHKSFSLSSLEYIEKISPLPDNCLIQLFESYTDSNTNLEKGELRFYINQRNKKLPM